MAIAAGNCVVYKPSERAPHVSNVQASLFKEFLDSRFYRCIEGGVSTSIKCTSSNFDKIVFTGGSITGKYVAMAAAKNLTPCILELGGKCPCIVDEDAKIEASCDKICFGKFTTAGQTCIAPDFIFIQKNMTKKFVPILVKTVEKFFGKSLEYDKSNNLGLMVHQNKAKNMEAYLEEKHGGSVMCGGKVDVKNRYCQPTIILNPKMSSKLMSQEVFGPILPIYEFDKYDEVINWINSNPKPLAIYYFGYNTQFFNRLELETQSGSLIQNDCICQSTQDSFPFGGVGNSGYGSVHSYSSFKQLSHMRPVMTKFPYDVFPTTVKLPPYTPLKVFITNNLEGFQKFSEIVYMVKILILLILLAYIYFSGKAPAVLRNLSAFFVYLAHYFE